MRRRQAPESGVWRVFGNVRQGPRGLDWGFLDDVPPALSLQRHSLDPAIVERTLAQGFWLLRFPAELEARFILARADERTFRLIVAAVNAVLVFGIMLVADWVLMPERFAQAVWLRLGVFGGGVLLGLPLLHRLSLPQLNEWMIVVVGGLASALIGTIALMGAHPVAYTQVIELLLVLIYVAVFARFWPMVVLSMIVVAVHGYVLQSVTDVVGSVGLGGGLLLLTTGVFGLYACYTRERNERLAFLLDLREQALRASLQEANSQLDELVRTDALTGLANRRAFDAYLQHIWQDEVAGQRPTALLLLDVDHFKSYNDLYGHQAGDACLQAVAMAIGSCLRRPVDLLARWGGEEFAIVLVDVTQEGAMQVAQRIRLAVELLGMPHDGAGPLGVVTVSIGLAVHEAGAEGSTAQWLQLADEALYAAKSSGRNQIRVAVMQAQWERCA
jgi:diguanylate cyclase (GGDEF)-like protein